MKPFAPLAITRRRFMQGAAAGALSLIPFPLRSALAAPAQDRRRDLAIDAGSRGLPAVNRQRHRSDFERKLGAAEDRRGRSKRAPQREGNQRERAGCSRSLHEAAAGNGEGSKRIHRPPPAGVIAMISYIPP